MLPFRSTLEAFCMNQGICIFERLLVAIDCDSAQCLLSHQIFPWHSSHPGDSKAPAVTSYIAESERMWHGLIPSPKIVAHQ